MPYVYYGKHKTTDHFYIGVRSSAPNRRKNLPSHLDILRYKTSSKTVKPIFEQFDWVILAEFFDVEAAYEFESALINESWGNPLLLNKHRSKKGSLIFRTDYKNQTKEESAKHRNNLSISNKIAWSLKTEAERQYHKEQVSFHSKQMWANKSNDEKNITSLRAKKTNSLRSDEDKKLRCDRISKANNLSCSVDGIEYINRNNAAKCLGITVSTLRARLKSLEYPLYIGAGKSEIGK